MVLEARVKLTKSPNSATIYLAIPAYIVKDSQFPFRLDDEVDLRINTEDRTLVVTGSEYKIKQDIARFREKPRLERKKPKKETEEPSSL